MGQVLVLELIFPEVSKIHIKISQVYANSGLLVGGFLDFNWKDDILKKSANKTIETAKILKKHEIKNSTVLLWLSTILSFKKYAPKKQIGLKNNFFTCFVRVI